MSSTFSVLFLECAQHSVHPTGGSRRVFGQFAWLGVGSVKATFSRPAHQRVTQAVRRLITSKLQGKTKMRTLKSLLVFFAVVGVVLSSCRSNTPVVSQTVITVVPTSKFPTATLTSVPEPIHTSTIAPTYTITPTISKTRVNLSPELYLDENSSPDNLRGEPYHPDQYDFQNDIESEGNGDGFVYHFGNEEWVAALTWTRIFPFEDKSHLGEVELRQHYIQVWRDDKFMYSFPVDGIGYEPKQLLRYEDHWIFWFMDSGGTLGRIVQDGVLLNDLRNYDNAFSAFLLDGKPFFFFQRGDQFGISFNNEEILLPYSNISYGMICCEGGGPGRWNPRATDSMVGFYVKRGDSDYQYIEVGVR